MAKYQGIPEMLEHYMAESGDTERWVTVGQLRRQYGFPQNRCTSVSRFLRRLHEGTYRKFPYIVKAIRRDPHCKPQEIGVLRYLIIKRQSIPDSQENLPLTEEYCGTEQKCREMS